MNFKSIVGEAFVKVLVVSGLVFGILLSGITGISHADHSHFRQELDFSDLTPGQELVCLALNIYHEGRGENSKGQAAIAAVTMNRVNSEDYPDTVCEVVWQRKQFSWTQAASKFHSVTDQRAWQQSLTLAKSFLESEKMTEVGNATHYHASTVQPYWASENKPIARVGNHLFYSFVTSGPDCPTGCDNGHCNCNPDQFR